MWSTLVYDFHVPTSSARSVNSSGLSLTVTSGYPSESSSLRPSKISQALVQVSYLKGTMVVNHYEISQPIREPFPAPLTEVRHDVLHEAVSIFLLVRQQLQRIGQFFAQALRYRMRFEDLGLINTFTCLQPRACLVASSPTFFHKSRTTNCYALFTQRPTKRSLPTGNCFHAGTNMTS